MTRVHPWLAAAAPLAVLFSIAVPVCGQAPVSSAPSSSIRPNFGPVLSAVYGQGVHAFYAHRLDEASMLLTEAINNGYQDPRAYYFRGLAADAQGRTYEAEADWQAGAELEASGKINGDIGRALARIQGNCRVRLEKIRREAKVMALLTQKSRSDARLNQLGSPVPGTPRVTPPPPPTSVDGDPFLDDPNASAQVEKADALEDVMKAGAEPFTDDASPVADGTPPAADETSPFDASDASPFDTDAGDSASPFDMDAGNEPDPFETPDDGGNPFEGLDSPF